MHVNETDLPLTLIRRRVTASGISVDPNVNHIPPEDVIESKTGPFSSFANLSASLWSSAQVCKMFFTCFLHILTPFAHFFLSYNYESLAICRYFEDMGDFTK